MGGRAVTLDSRYCQCLWRSPLPSILQELLLHFFKHKSKTKIKNWASFFFSFVPSIYLPTHSSILSSTHPFLHPSTIYPHIHSSTHLSTCLPIHPSIHHLSTIHHLSINSLIYPSIHHPPSIYLLTHLPIYPPVHPSIHHLSNIHPSIHSPIHSFIHLPFIYLPIHPSIHHLLTHSSICSSIHLPTHPLTHLPTHSSHSFIHSSIYLCKKHLPRTSSLLTIHSSCNPHVSSPRHVRKRRHSDLSKVTLSHRQH